MQPAVMAPIPVIVVTGFLGSGKSTLILNLLAQLPKTYKVITFMTDTVEKLTIITASTSQK